MVDAVGKDFENWLINYTATNAFKDLYSNIIYW